MMAWSVNGTATPCVDEEYELRLRLWLSNLKLSISGEPTRTWGVRKRLRFSVMIDIPKLLLT